jgi:hypothetical protein
MFGPILHSSIVLKVAGFSEELGTFIVNNVEPSYAPSSADESDKTYSVDDIKKQFQDQLSLVGTAEEDYAVPADQIRMMWEELDATLSPFESAQESMKPFDPTLYIQFDHD